MACVGVLKLAFRRSRPSHNIDDMIVEAPFIDQFSFPSGHSSRGAMLALVFHARLSVMKHQSDIIPNFTCTVFSQDATSHWLVGFTVCSYSLALCLSRVVLGRHYLSDALAGYFLGIVEALVVLNFLWLENGTSFLDLYLTF